MKTATIRFCATIAFSLGATPAMAQSGGPYDLSWNTVDGGGTSSISGGVYTVAASISQHDANTELSAGTFALFPGFCAGFPSEEDGPCSPADLAEPYATLDFFDVLAYLALFDAMDPAADLAAPFGTFDFFDVLAYLGSFDAGCP